MIRDLAWLMWIWVFAPIGVVTVVLGVAGLIFYGLMAAAIAESEGRR